MEAAVPDARGRNDDRTARRQRRNRLDFSRPSRHPLPTMMRFSVRGSPACSSARDFEGLGQTGEGERAGGAWSGSTRVLKRRHCGHPDAADSNDRAPQMLLGRDPGGVPRDPALRGSCRQSRWRKRRSCWRRPAAGYLLKSRVADVDEFVGHLGRIPKGAAVVIRAGPGARHGETRHDPLEAVTRERARSSSSWLRAARTAASAPVWVTEDRSRSTSAASSRSSNCRDRGRPQARARGAVVPRRALILAAANATGWPVTG